ncbi:YkvA family protein [Pseudomonas sp. RIT-PI-AD]|uniref:YkvA family protein n=1 Tax=Pseudomonas sp. RIT-PI-AD TaxID=3035294 RepID=UPI0021D8E82D|nr:YkvA family protein [Pseudomonas sp. RIT-PI-AD]
MKTPWNFSRYLPLAERFLVRGRLPALLLAVMRKSTLNGGRLGGLKEDLRTMQSLCMAWWRGEYRAIDRQALLAVVGALLYFLTPFDAIPDWLPGLGLIDDLAVVAWVLRTWSGELDKFRVWHDAQSPALRKDLERLPVAERVDRKAP